MNKKNVRLNLAAAKKPTRESMGLPPDAEFIRVTPSSHDIVYTDPGYRVKSDKNVKFTAKRAADYIKCKVFEEERRAYEKDVNYLYDHMLAGTFNFSNTTLAFAWLNGVKFKVNGQHTCWAVAYLRQDFATTVREVVYEVDSEEALRGLYATFDAGKARSAGHRVQVLLAGKPCVEGVPSSLLIRMSKGFRLWLSPSPSTQSRYSPEYIVDVIEENHAKLFNRVGLFLAKHRKDNSHLTRKGITAAMFATFDVAAKPAQEFWEAVATGLNISSQTDPRYVLRKQMEGGMSFRTVETAGAGRKFKRYTGEEVYRSCISAWNKYRKGLETRGKIRPTATRIAPR